MKHKITALAIGLFVAIIFLAPAAHAYNYIANTSDIAFFGPYNAASGNAAQVTFNADGSVSTTFDPTLSGSYNGAYDGSSIGNGSDDVAIGFYNAGTSTITSVNLSGGVLNQNNNYGMFAFDGDDNFGAGGSGTVGTAYAGGFTISGVSSTGGLLDNNGTLNFTGGLAPGEQAWYAFEDTGSALQSGGILPTPEPGSLLLVASVVLAFGLVGLRKKYAEV